jgi:integrase
MDFYSQLIAYRNEKKKAINTIGMDIKVLKTMMHYTYEKGLHQNNIHTKDDFRAFEEVSEHIYLNDKELDILWNLKKLPKPYELVRDIFLIGCYTSLRISDLGTLEEFNIIQGSGGPMLKIIQHKGSEPVFIPMHKRVKLLLKKYGGKFPKAYAEQTMNEYIRKVCEIAELNEQQQFKITRGGKVERFVKKKWQMVTNHTARRSFATNLVIAGFNPLAVMKITGHKTMKDFMRYVCVTQQEMAVTMASHKYFK